MHLIEEQLFKDAAPSLEEENLDIFNGDFSGSLKISDSKTKMENVPITNPYSDRTPTMDDVGLTSMCLMFLLMKTLR